MKQRDDLWQRIFFFFINLITKSNHIWVGSWNTVGSHSFFGGEVTGASLVAFFLGMRERERERFWGMFGWKREFLKFLNRGKCEEEREEKLKEQRKRRVTQIADVCDWAVQFLSIRSIEWLGLKQLHTVQYPRNCTGCESRKY